jgi:PAS domain S-box-containing protein
LERDPMTQWRGGFQQWRIAGTAIACIGIAALLWYLRSPQVPDKIYRVGWRIYRPFVYQGPDGKPTGMIVDLFQEAARRRGIRLQWVTAPSAVEAVQNNQADLFPLLTANDERRKYLYFTEPYFEDEQCLLLRADSTFNNLKDLSSATISLSDRPTLIAQVRSSLPNARQIAHTDPSDALADVCSGLSDAAFLEEGEANAALLSGACGNAPLKMRLVPGSNAQMAVGSTYECRPVADAIRAEISRMAEEGELPDLVSHWIYFSSSKMESTNRLLNAGRRERYLWGLVGLFVILFGAAVWQAARIHRERIRAERAERALSEAERDLRLTANNLREMVLAYDMNGCLIYANPAVDALTGYSRDELRQKPHHDWIHADDRDRMLRLWDSLYAGSSFEEEEYRLVTGSGEIRWIASSWGPMRNEAGLQVGVQGIERDISERKKSELEHAKLEEQLRQSQKLESVGILAGGVAHDFNNLLTVINGYSEMLLGDLHPQDPMRDTIAEIRKSGQRAAELTQQLLAFSRRQIIQPKSINLNDIISHSLSMYRRLIGEDIELVANLASSPGQVFADPSQIQQVIMNLVVNARDAMPAGGKLVLATLNMQLDESFVAHHAEVAPGPYVQLSVTDTGAGMDEETRLHIFEPFFTTKPVGEGTGLGLATVYGIVRQNKGWIWIYSEPNKGTTFKIHLPRSSAKESEQERAPEERVVAARAAERILVVEDQAEVMGYTVDVLKKNGYRVESAATADEALALLKDPRVEFDLLITDVVLPGMNGKQLADLLVQQKPGLKVLFMTGYPGELLNRRGMMLNDIDILSKPFTPSTLTIRVRSILDRSLT